MHICPVRICFNIGFSVFDISIHSCCFSRCFRCLGISHHSRKDVIGPAYIEGHIVGLLIKCGSRMKESDLQKCYAQYGSLDFVVSRLNARGVIRVENGIIELVGDEVSRGFKNKLMMWATRKVKM
jgi:hypothetical protein